MSEVKRYTDDDIYGRSEDTEGPYVLFEDHARALAELEAQPNARILALEADCERHRLNACAEESRADESFAELANVKLNHGIELGQMQERVKELEAELSLIRETLLDSNKVHTNILRGTIALSKASAIHIAGLPANIEADVARLQAELAEARKPVTQEELVLVLGNEPTFQARLFAKHVRSFADKLIAARAPQPAQPKGEAQQ